MTFNLPRAMDNGGTDADRQAAITVSYDNQKVFNFILNQDDHENYSISNNRLARHTKN